MIFFDRVIIGGVRWVLEKVALAVDAEQPDEEAAYQEELWRLQAELELGRLSPEEFARRQAEILQSLGEIRKQRQGSGEPLEMHSGDFRVVGVEVEGPAESAAGPLEAEPPRATRPPAVEPGKKPRKKPAKRPLKKAPKSERRTSKRAAGERPRRARGAAAHADRRSPRRKRGRAGARRRGR